MYRNFVPDKRRKREAFIYLFLRPAKILAQPKPIPMSAVASQSRRATSATASIADTKNFQWWSMLLLIALVVVTFWPTLRNGFIWDDDLLVTENALVKSSTGLADIWFSAKAIDYFPITNSDFWFEWRLWGMNPAGYHATNLILHAINAVLLWRVLRMLFPSNGVFGTAFFGAALYALHPVNAGTVAWIAERKNTLSMVFVLLSTLYFFKAEESKSARPYIISVVFFLLSMLSKTAGVTLPLVFLLITWWKRGLTKRDVIRTVPFFAIAFIMGLVTIWFQSQHALGADFPNRPIPLRIAGAGAAIWFYISKALFPISLSPIYAQWNIDATKPITYLPHIALVVLAALLWSQQKRLGKGPLVALAAFVLMLLPVVGLLNANYFKFSLVADHWQYFSVPIATVAIAWAATQLFRDFSVAALAIITAAFAVLSWQECHLFDNARMWRAVLDKDPNSYIGANNYAEYLQEEGHYDEALKNFRHALELHPGYRNALMGEATTFLRQDKYAEAIAPLEQLLKAQPDNFFIRYNIGSAYFYLAKPQQAVEHLSAALTIPADEMPTQKQWHYSGDNKSLRAQAESRLADSFAALGKRDDAVKAFEAALELAPDSFLTHYHYANLLAQMHDRDAARKHWRETIRLNPEMIDAMNDLAWSLATDSTANRAERIEAKQTAMRAAQLTRFNEPGILDTLAAASAAAGEFEDAAKFGTQAINLAKAKGDNALAADLQKRVDGYNQKKAYTE
jgi:protein O-mannosyl-transferase